MDLRPVDQRILVGPTSTLRATITDQEGEADASVDANVTVSITRLDGTAVVSDVAASCTNGEATYSLAAQTSLDYLTCVWKVSGVERARTYVDVARRYYFSLTRLGQEDGVSTALAAGSGDHTNSKLAEARLYAESLVESVTGVAWVPRASRDTLDAYDLPFVRLNWPMPYNLRSLTIDGSAQTTTDYVLDESGKLRLTSGGVISCYTPQGVDVLYDHGFKAPRQDVIDIALTIAAHYLFDERTSTLSMRATQTTSEVGIINLGRIDRDHPTGIPKIDERLLALRWRGGIGVA